MTTNDELQSMLKSAKTLSEIGRRLNDRIEVRWLLVHDEEQEPQKKWWGARLIEEDSEEKKLITLLYDAAEGFEETQSKVLFLSEHWIYDLEEKSEVPYREEGDAIDSSGCERAENDIVTFDELLEEDDTTTALACEEMKKLPHTTQIRVVERLEEFKNGFIDFLKEKTEQRGPNALIDADDIAEFASKLKAKDQ